MLSIDDDSHLVRKHIMMQPRALRKRNVYEGVARFLDIPSGQEIVQESYAQLRKFNCWNISIVQQYARFKQSRIRMQKQRNQIGSVRLYSVQLPEQRIDGVPFQPSTKLLRIEE